MKPILIQTYLSSGQSTKEFIASHQQLSQADVRALQILDSQHVRSVVIRFVEEVGNTRLYLALTHNGSHRYHVRFHNHTCADGTTFRVGKCDCPAGSVPVNGFEGEQEYGVCRHLIAAAWLASQESGEDFYTSAVARYRGHLTVARMPKAISKFNKAAVAA